MCFYCCSIWDPDDDSTSHTVCDCWGQYACIWSQQQPGENGEWMMSERWKWMVKWICETKDVLVPIPVQTHYVISEGQTELESKQTVPQNTTQAHTEHLEQQSTNQQATTQYIITTTTNGSGTSEVHITKPWTVSASARTNPQTDPACRPQQLVRTWMNKHSHMHIDTDLCTYRDKRMGWLDNRHSFMCLGSV